jgi:hypothetical protein
MEGEQNVPDGLTPAAEAAATAHAEIAPAGAHLETHDRVDLGGVAEIGERWEPQGAAVEQE